MRITLLLHLSLAVAAVFGFSACDSQSKASQDSRAPGAENLDPRIETVALADLEKHESGLRTYGGELFDGRAVERAADGSLRKEFYFSRGLIEGIGREWHENGGLKFDRHYREGKPEGPALEWNTEGEVSQVLFRNGIEVDRKDGPLTPRSKPSP